MPCIFADARLHDAAALDASTAESLLITQANRLRGFPKLNRFAGSVGQSAQPGLPLQDHAEPYTQIAKKPATAALALAYDR